MTLQQLIGELQTLAHAYPDTTPVLASWRDMDRCEVVGVRIVIEAQ